MIGAADEFLRHIVEARTELLRACEALRRRDVQAAHEHHEAAQLANTAAIGMSPRLGIIFPPGGPEGQHIFELAHNTGRAVFAFADTVSTAIRDQEAGRAQGGPRAQAVTQAMGRIGAQEALFSKAAREQVWRRWFLGMTPRHALSARLGRGRRQAADSRRPTG